MFNKIPIFSYIKNYKNIQRFKILSEDDKRYIQFYQQFIKPGELVFDVGANMGNRTKIFLELGAKVVAFEPQKLCSDFLKLALKNNDNFTLVDAALGGKLGEGEMLISDSHTVSTLSKHWVEATKKSGRFSQCEWNKKQKVPITTLDIEIKKFGIPSFIKIDVEGYEHEVLSGLRHPVPCVSIEFAAENIMNTFKCIDYLNSLSNFKYQFSEEESLHFHLPAWVSDAEIKNFLEKISYKNKSAWGDVYIKNINKKAN